MVIELDSHARRELADAIKAHFRSERDEEIGDLQASFFLDFILREIGPAVYNRALSDVQAHLRDVVADLDVTLAK